MRKYFILISLLIILLIPVLPLKADVIITKDNMILNGKIIEDKENDYIKFANYHGNFTIKYAQIKEIHRTESFEEDVKFYQKNGKSADENEIRINYQSGEEKLLEHEKKSVNTAGLYVFMIDFFCDKNSGKLDSMVPLSSGISISGEIPVVNAGILNRLFIYNLDIEADFYYSQNGVMIIKGYRLAAGPLWRIPVVIFDYSFNFNISVVVGGGWYSVENAMWEATAVKWNASIHAGPAFDIHSVIISPQVRFDYIHEADVPLYGMGISLGAGYKF